MAENSYFAEVWYRPTKKNIYQFTTTYFIYKNTILVVYIEQYFLSISVFKSCFGILAETPILGETAFFCWDMMFSDEIILPKQPYFGLTFGF